MNKYPGLEAVMISCEQREAARQLTIPQFEKIGIPVWVAYSPCSPAGPQQNCIASVHALHHAYALGKDCLFLEDDVDIDPELFEYFLRQAIEKDAVTYFYLHDKPNHMHAFYGREVTDRIMTKKPIRRDLYAIKHQKHMYGTQAVYLPYWFYAPFVKNGMFQSTQGSFDVFLSRHVVTRKTQAYIALPHPVQHRHDRTARVGIGAVGKFSSSFGLPWFESGENEPIEASGKKFDFCAENPYELERLLPLWQAFPWALRGSFYMQPEAMGRIPMGGKIEPFGSLNDSGDYLVTFDSGTSWRHSPLAARRMPNRNVITVGGRHARVNIGLTGIPYLHFPDYGQSEANRTKVGFVFTTTQAFAKHCRFLPEFARTALLEVRRGDSVRANQLVLPESGATVPASGRTGVADEHGLAEPAHTLSDDIGFRLGMGDVAATAARHLHDAATQWFRKFGIKFSADSRHIIAFSDVVASDDEFILMEAAALGKKTVMIDLDKVTPVDLGVVPLAEPEIVVEKILEAAGNG